MIPESIALQDGHSRATRPRIGPRPDARPVGRASLRYLGWFGVLRLGLVQTSLGAIVVLTTTTINRVMVVELALPALLPGFLVGLHYAVQLTRPRMGHGSDRGGRRTPWIVGGVAVLGLGGALAAIACALAATATMPGIALALLAFVLVGLGVGCAGTSLLVLLADAVAPRYRGAAATTVWVMMIVGFIVTTIVAGAQLDPFSFERLVVVTGTVSAIAFAVTCVAMFGVERRVGTARERAAIPQAASAEAEAERVRTEGAAAEGAAAERVTSAETAVVLGAAPGPVQGSAPGPAPETAPGADAFRDALREVWAEPEARRFSLFVFVSMLAYSAQDLILEPFAGTVFGLTPGQSTQLSGAHHGGVLAGMLVVALATSLLRGRRLGSLRVWTVGGCAGSALALLVLAAGGLGLPGFALRPAVFALGLANGTFAVAAIGSMMALVGHGARRREGVRMGLWGAAQAIAFGAGGILATSAVDLSGLLASTPAVAYAVVFAAQSLLFVLAARLALNVYAPAAPERQGPLPVGRMALETQS